MTEPTTFGIESQEQLDAQLERRGPRFDRWTVAFLVAAVAAFVMVLFLGRSLTFYHDDWRYIDDRLAWTPDVFLRPHNQHWTLVLAALWKPMLATVGLTSYLPYLAINAIAHAALAAAMYWLVRRLADPASGLVAGIVMLTLGVSAELLFHAHGAHLILATALGAWAFALVIAARPSRSWLVAALLVLGVMTGGPALFFIVAIAVYLFFVPERRSELWVIVPSVVIYAIWYLAYGQADGVAFRGTIGELVALWDWVRIGMSAAVGALIGLRQEIGLVVLVILAVATLWQLLGPGPYLVAALAALAGLAAQVTLTGVARIELEGSPADAPRYSYTGAVFALVALAAWYGSRPRPRAINSLPILGLAVAAMIFHLQTIRWWADEWYTPHSQETRAAITVALEHGGTPALPGDRRPVHPTDPFMAAIPSPDRLREIIGILAGDPLDDAWQPGTYPIPADVLARVQAEILGQPDGG